MMYFSSSTVFRFSALGAEGSKVKRKEFRRAISAAAAPLE